MEDGIHFNHRSDVLAFSSRSLLHTAHPVTGTHTSRAQPGLCAGAGAAQRSTGSCFEFHGEQEERCDGVFLLSF